MAIYCDESGGIGAGAMTFAAVHIEHDAAQALLDRFREITHIRGEMKGSRIDLVERGLFFELLEKSGAIAHVAILRRDHVSDVRRASRTLDLDGYAYLLDEAIGALLPRTGGCGEIVIDDGRYDAKILSAVRGEIGAMLGNWGRARLIESHRSAGVQIADVVANSCFNLTIGSNRATRIRAIMRPMLEKKLVRMEQCRLD